MYATKEIAPRLRPPCRETYLTFLVGTESYCLPFLRIAEVRTLRNCSPVLEGPTYERGIIALHNRTIPLLDLRVRFGEPAAFTTETRLIAAWITRVGRPDTSIALLVDRVENLVPIDPGTVDAEACAGFACTEEFLRGIANLNGVPTALLNLEELVRATRNSASRTRG